MSILRQENAKLQDIIKTLKQSEQAQGVELSNDAPSPVEERVLSPPLVAFQTEQAPRPSASDEPTISPALVRRQSFSPPSHEIFAYASQQVVDPLPSVSGVLAPRQSSVSISTSAPGNTSLRQVNISPVGHELPQQTQLSTTTAFAFQTQTLGCSATGYNQNFSVRPDAEVRNPGQQNQPISSDLGQDDATDSETDPDVSPFISIDEEGKLASYGPSSALQSSLPHTHVSKNVPDTEHQRNSLIANAVISRQKEHMLYSQSDLDGVPTDLALHLLDMHWNRQHHTFLLTYRPAIMRDLISGGPYASRFLLNAIFACSAKYSRRVEVQDVPDDTSTAGAHWFRRCDQLLYEDKLLLSPSISTVVGLTLLGSTYNARGEISKGWLLQGYAFRMAYDLGLHLDKVSTTQNAEEAEIRRRVFWGVFICDKLQSLYLGRPIAMHSADAHVSQDFLDTMEEGELWTPYVDPTRSDSALDFPFASTPTRSVSCFRQLCLLSKIMESVIKNNYVIGATSEKAMKGLRRIDSALEKWMRNLPNQLHLSVAEHAIPPPPNVFNIHAIYHTLVVLLHRPIIAEGHLYAASASTSSLKRCTIAARAITLTMTKYFRCYGLRSAPYLFAYALYVACTIHVRNAAMFEQNTGRGEHCSLLTSSLHQLEQICVPNPVVSRPIAIIRKLMATKGVKPIEADSQISPTTYAYQMTQQMAILPDVMQSLDDLPDLDFPATESIANWLGDPQDPFRDDQLYGFMEIY